MKRLLTILLRLATLVAGISILASDVGITWWVVRVWANNPIHAVILTVLIVGLYSATIPLFIVFYQSVKILDYIDKECVFSELSVNAMDVIIRCAGIIFGACTVAGLPFFYYWAQLDDAPGLMIIGLVMAGITFSITIFASLLKRLCQDAIAIKSEKDIYMNSTTKL